MLFRLPRLAWVFPLATLLLGAGCAPKIGKSCTLSTDCSQLGDRLCDTTQPQGYCTIFNCEPDTCPEAVCIGFDSQIDPACGGTQASQASRFERTFCMKGCNDDSDCRDGYQCKDPKALSATIVDLTLPSTSGICIAGTESFSHCGPGGNICAQDSNCCSASCDPVTKRCAPVPVCGAAGKACAKDTECCSASCNATLQQCDPPKICGVTDPGLPWTPYMPDGGASTSASSSSGSSASSSASSSSGSSSSSSSGAGGAGGASGTSTGTGTSTATGAGGAGGMGTATASSSSTG